MVEIKFYIEAKKDLNNFYEGFLELIENIFPYALPNQYGLVEPPEYILSKNGKKHFLDLLCKNRNIVWYGTFPVKYIMINDWRSNKWGEPYYKVAHKPHEISIWIDDQYYKKNTGKSEVNTFFIEASKFFDVTYAEINKVISSDFSMLIHNMTKKNFWQGDFSHMGSPCIIGKPYCEYVKKEKGIILNSTKDLIYFEINVMDGLVAKDIFEKDFYKPQRKVYKNSKAEINKKKSFYKTLSICKAMKKDNIDWNLEECIEYEKWFYTNLENRPQYLLNYIEKTCGCLVKKMYSSGDPECLTVIWKWFLGEIKAKQNSLFSKKDYLSGKMKLILMDIGFLWGNFLVQNCSELKWYKIKNKNDMDYNLIQIGKFTDTVLGRKGKYYYYIDSYRIVDSLIERINKEEQQITDLKNEYLYWRDISEKNASERFNSDK